MNHALSAKFPKTNTKKNQFCGKIYYAICHAYANAFYIIDKNPINVHRIEAFFC